MKIVWPDKTFQTLKNIDVNQSLTLVLFDAKPFDYAELSTKKVSLVAAQDVPEPTAILGFMAFGAYGAGSMFKRKRKP